MKPMSDNAEDIVSKFYNTVGWETNNGITEDAKRWEDLREHAKEYVRKCRLRVLRHIPNNGENILDMASGPIQYKEYLEYSKNFEKRYCVDLSSQALEDAKKKIGDHGVFLCGSFFDITLEENFFDCTVSLHTIYHIDKDEQEDAARKLIYVAKPGQPIIIVYSNPNPILSRFTRAWNNNHIATIPSRVLKRIKRMLQKNHPKRMQKKDSGLYFYAYPIEWWNRFGDVADIKIMPWRSFSSDIQKRYIPNNKMGSKMFDMLFNLEERFPEFFVKHFQYLMIILTKRIS